MKTKNAEEEGKGNNMSMEHRIDWIQQEIDWLLEIIEEHAACLDEPDRESYHYDDSALEDLRLEKQEINEQLQNKRRQS